MEIKWIILIVFLSLFIIVGSVKMRLRIVKMDHLDNRMASFKKYLESHDARSISITYVKAEMNEIKNLFDELLVEDYQVKMHNVILALYVNIIGKKGYYGDTGEE